MIISSPTKLIIWSTLSTDTRIDEDSAAAFLGFSLAAGFGALALEAVLSAGACGAGAAGVEASGSAGAGSAGVGSVATPSTALISI